MVFHIRYEQTFIHHPNQGTFFGVPPVQTAALHQIVHGNNLASKEAWGIHCFAESVNRLGNLEQMLQEMLWKK